MPRRPDNLLYAVDDVPPLVTTVLLGLQQLALMAIYLVMVVIVVRAAGASHQVAESAVSFGLMAMGISAALQAIWKGPIGSGYLAPPVISAIYLPPSLLAVHAGGLPLVFGMTILAGAFEALLAWLLPRLRLVFPPLVCGFIIAAVGFELGLIGSKQFLDVAGLQQQYYGRHVLVAMLTLGVMVGLSVWGRGVLRLLCSLVGLMTGFAVAGWANLIEPAAVQAIRDAPVLALPTLSHLDYAFDLAVAVPFLLAGLAAGLRTIGVVTTCQRINDADWKRPDLRTIRGGVLADGLGCAIGGVLGVNGMGSAPSLVGVAQASGATSRYIAFAACGLSFVFACFPKLGAVFLALPDSVVGAAVMFTASFMIAGGIQIMGARELDTRKTFVVGISILLGLSRQLFPSYFEALPYALRVMSGSLLSLAMVSAIVLNLVFHIGLRRTADVILEGTDEPRKAGETLAEVVRRSAKAWHVDADLAERARSVAARVIEMIEDGDLADGPITARVTFDEITFEIGILYRGDLLQVATPRPISTDHLLEEQPFVTGLAGFLVGVYADRVSASTNDGACRLQLTFDA